MRDLEEQREMGVDICIAEGFPARCLSILQGNDYGFCSLVAEVVANSKMRHVCKDLSFFNPLFIKVIA